MLRWMMTYPTPRWVVSDPGRYHTSAEFLDFPNRGGIGLSVVPCEAHRLLGNEESAIGVAKKQVARLLREGSSLSIPPLHHGGPVQ